MTIGTMVGLQNCIEEGFLNLKSLGLSHCQLSGFSEALCTEEFARRILEAIDREGVTITTYWCGWPGPAVWDFYEGPLTLGLTPVAYRFARTEALKKGSDFAAALGVRQMATHAGFIPENPADPEYPGIVSALKDVVNRCKQNGQIFLFETGQETPVTLRRLIDDLGTEGIGVNFDPANLLLYGKANPLDALDILGEFVRDIHAKDGEYPTNGRYLGEEKALGQGRVNFPALLKKLKGLGYDGPITIEREISGEEQIKDILAAAEMLRGLI